MSKVFSSTEDQIKKLQSRVMIIDDINVSKSVIERENYYNLINGYKELFLDNTYTGSDEKYLQNTNFNEIYALYLYDRALRNIFIKYILEIENNIKSILSHDFSGKYGHDNYLKIKNFETRVHPNSNETKAQKIGKIADLIANLQKEISHQLKKNSPMISHYMLQYGYVPLWVLINTLSLGTVSTFYSYLKQKDQNDIGKFFKIKPDELSKILFVLTIFRNACAHDERLFNLKSIKQNATPNNIKDTDIHKKLNIHKNTSNNYVCGKNDLFAVVIIFKKMLTEKSFKKFYYTIIDEIENLRKELKTISIDDVLYAMGFPNNWKDIINI